MLGEDELDLQSTVLLRSLPSKFSTLEDRKVARSLLSRSTINYLGQTLHTVLGGDCGFFHSIESSSIVAKIGLDESVTRLQLALAF